jgi:hypothetical protein
MARTTAFGKVLELAETLSLDEKESLLELLTQRTISERRKHLARESAKARREHRQGRAKAISVADLMKEITK